MTRVALISDLHYDNPRILGGPSTAGVNLRCELIAQAHERAIELAAQAGCDYGAVLGDIFNTAKPPPEVIGRAARAFARSPFDWWLIPGNHDCSSDAPGHSALAALEKSSRCRVADKPMYLLPEGVILAPFSPRPPVEYFREVLSKARPGLKFLLGHVGIVGPGTPLFMREGRNTITMEQIYELGLVPGDVDLGGFYAGDYHKHEIHDGICGAVNTVQIGALCQADFGDPLEVGKICILDTEKGGIVEIIDVPGPRFLKISFADLSSSSGNAALARLDGCDLFLSVVCKDDGEVWETGEILNGAYVAGWKIDLLPSAKQQSEVVEAVRGAVQVGEALREWVAAQPEPDEVKERAVQIAEECLRCN